MLDAPLVALYTLLQFILQYTDIQKGLMFRAEKVWIVHGILKQQYKMSSKEKENPLSFSKLKNFFRRVPGE